MYVIYIGIDAASRDQNPMMLWLILIPVIMVSADLTIFWACQKQIVANNFTAMQTVGGPSYPNFAPTRPHPHPNPTPTAP